MIGGGTQASRSLHYQIMARLPPGIIYSLTHSVQIYFIINLSNFTYRTVTLNWRFFEAKLLASLCCHLKRYRQTRLQFILTYLVHEENAGPFDPKINVLLLGDE